MARTLRRVGGIVFSAFFLVGLAVLNTGGARAGESRESARDKAERDAEFSRFVESTMTPAASKQVKIETVAATCDPGKVRAARLDQIQKAQRQIIEMHRQQLSRAVEQNQAQGGVVAVGEPIARSRPGSDSKR